MKPPSFPSRPSFLIVSLRYIGDVLLSTPLALSIKTHLPDARIDYLVFKGTEGVLAKNPHVQTVHTVAPGSMGLKQLAGIWRHYDFSIGANWSDRTGIISSLTGRHSTGFYHFKRKEWWKPFLLSQCNFFDGNAHMVPIMLSQLESLKIPALPRVVMGFDEEDAGFARKQLGAGGYILLHPYSRQSYKYWPAVSWAKLAEIIRQSGLRPLFTSPAAVADEKQFHTIERAANGVMDSFPQPFTLPQLAAAIQQSRGYVGIDTVATHMAAALEVPTIALYGPTRVTVWGPWPNDWQGSEPYAPGRRIQTRGRITVMQQSWPCVPCNKELCPISSRGKMECLEALSPEAVFESLQSVCL
jgi:heptosyltransferase III